MKGIELSKVLDKWFESRQGSVAANGDFLSHPDNAIFLRNRLKAAFLAGVKAQKKIYSETA